MFKMSHYGSPEEVERRVQLAIAAFDGGVFAKLSQATDHFFVPYHRAYGRLHGKPSKIGGQPTHTKFDAQQKQALLNYIKLCDASGFSAFPGMIHGAASINLNAHIKATPTSHPSWPGLGHQMAQKTSGAT
jgi:hypothetical protein